jgi:DNA-binding PadR family transcriptional regulator
MADPLERVTKPTLDVLEALLEAPDHTLHGWVIVKTTGRSGPTVYKILERLAAAGWLDRWWEEPGPDENRPRRRYFHLTPNGAVRAQALVAERRPQAAAKLRLAFGCGGAR